MLLGSSFYIVLHYAGDWRSDKIAKYVAETKSLQKKMKQLKERPKITTRGFHPVADIHGRKRIL